MRIFSPDRTATVQGAIPGLNQRGIDCHGAWAGSFCMRSDAFLTYRRLECFGYQNRAVCLLVILKDRHKSPAHGDRRAVQGVHETCSLLPWNFVADIEPARLVVGAIRCAGDLAVFAGLSSTG